MSETSDGGAKTHWNQPSAVELQRLQQLLRIYTESVYDGDAKRFESQLLNLDIPFSGVASSLPPSTSTESVKNYAGFKKAIFDGGKRFRQRFTNLKFEQIGALAQISLDYETAEQHADFSSRGWKVLQLLKVGDDWKIASEFYTGYPKP